MAWQQSGLLYLEQVFTLDKAKKSEEKNSLQRRKTLNQQLHCCSLRNKVNKYLQIDKVQLIPLKVAFLFLSTR